MRVKYQKIVNKENFSFFLVFILFLFGVSNLFSTFLPNDHLFFLRSLNNNLNNISDTYIIGIKNENTDTFYNQHHVKVWSESRNYKMVYHYENAILYEFGEVTLVESWPLTFDGLVNNRNVLSQRIYFYPGTCDDFVVGNKIVLSDKQVEALGYDNPQQIIGKELQLACQGNKLDVVVAGYYDTDTTESSMNMGKVYDECFKECIFVNQNILNIFDFTNIGISIKKTNNDLRFWKDFFASYKNRIVLFDFFRDVNNNFLQTSHNFYNSNLLRIVFAILALIIAIILLAFLLLKKPKLNIEILFYLTCFSVLVIFLVGSLVPFLIPYSSFGYVFSISIFPVACLFIVNSMCQKNKYNMEIVEVNLDV